MQVGASLTQGDVWHTHSKGEVVLNISSSVPATVTPNLRTIDNKPWLIAAPITLQPRESLLLAGGRRLMVGV